MGERSVTPSGQPEIPLREWASIHMELLWVYDHNVPGKYLDWEVEGQRKVYRAWLIRGGNVRVTQANGASVQAKAGSWIFPPRGDFHQQFSRDARILSINFLCEWPSGEGLVSAGAPIVVDNARFPALERRARQLERVVRRHFPETDTRYYERTFGGSQFLSFHTLFLKWLDMWLEVQSVAGTTFTRLSSGDDRVIHAVRCLNTAPIGGGYPRDALFRETGLSEAHLNRLFVAEYGITTRRSWEGRRLNEARRCLEASRLPIKEMAYRLGFRADAHFATWFKKLTGKRPNEYRKTHATAPI
jgi:AraC-like DNA-binding protein